MVSSKSSKRGSPPNENNRLERVIPLRNSTDESHRGRLRVEIARLRDEVAPLADIQATKHGFVMTPRRGRDFAILAPIVEEVHDEVLAFMADGEAWSSSALAIALGASPRTVQRALNGLAAAGRVRSFGKGRGQRWTSPPLPASQGLLLLPGSIFGA